MTVLGIDLGTSGAKAVIADEAGAVLAEASVPIEVSAPRPGWSEQQPDLWVDAVGACLDALAARDPQLMGAVEALGLSGQMLGAVLLDAADRPLRPAILWNDQRALAECAVLRKRVPDIGRRANGIPDPGLTAPKLMWLAANEPRVLDHAVLLLLPKDFLRLWLTGERATEPTDAGGTMLLDVRTGRWDAELCAAAGWDEDRLPPVVPSWSAAGGLRPALAARWGLRPGLPVAAGAGDNMACALGAGAARPGEAAITLGTSAVVCAVEAAFRPAPESAILTSAHAVPGAFLSMAVVMSATASLAWLGRITSVDAVALAREAEAFVAAGRVEEAPLCRPSLTGLRTPQNRPNAAGAFAGLTSRTDRAALAYAVMEGVAFQIRECVEAQRRAGLAPASFVAVGGGARSALWRRLIASALGEPLGFGPTAPVAAPLGAARLARAAVAAGSAAEVMGRDVPAGTTEAPDPALTSALNARFQLHRSQLG